MEHIVVFFMTFGGLPRRCHVEEDAFEDNFDFAWDGVA